MVFEIFAGLRATICFGTAGGSNESFGRFNITGASFREEWNAPMRSVKDINQILDIAEKNNQPQYKALGLICKVYVLSLMTDAYGDIPYNEAGRGGSFFR